MNPRIGKRSKYNPVEKKAKPKSVSYIELNNRKSITIRQEYLYFEDVKTAMNIHHLETSIQLKSWLIKELAYENGTEKLLKRLENSIDCDQHRL
ncbi:MAG: hypothetical protein KQI35_11670 [Bacteroidetes bacterium]|nr:hypothetical protein [Bacteroidota bacterium]